MLEAFEAGEFESDVENERRSQLAKLAKRIKEKRINIQISNGDLEALLA